MKAIYQGRIYTVVDTAADGLTLEGAAGIVDVSYASEDLIIDPTDGEIDAARGNDAAARPGRGDLWDLYWEAGVAHREAMQAADAAGRHYCTLYFRYRGE